MFVLSSISMGLEFWSVNHTSIYQSSESDVFKCIKYWMKYLIIDQIIDQLVTNVTQFYIHILIEGLSVFLRAFLKYIQNNLEYIIQNMIHQVIQILHSMSELRF